MPPPELLEVQQELAALLGPGVSAHRGCRLVVSPSTHEEVARVLRYATSRGLAVEIAGAGTKRAWGLTIAQSEAVAAPILLDTLRLSGLREHSWQDMTATVAAGTPWAEMQQALAVHRQFVALDPLWPGRATVGGIVAANDSGSLRLRYGSLRDLVLGMTLVLPDGAVARSGGKVVKNVAGYDLHKLMIGSLGTLAVVAEITFRLHPLPVEPRAFTLAAPPQALGELLLRVLQSPIDPLAMQLRAAPGSFALDLLLDGHPAAFAERTRALIDLARPIPARPIPAQPPQPQPQPAVADLSLFTARQQLFDSAAADPSATLLKLGVLPTAIAPLATEIVRLGGRAVAQATGAVAALFAGPDASSAVADLRQHLAALPSASLTVLQPGLAAADPVAPRVSPRSLALMHEIRRRFDPQATLNPGRSPGSLERRID